MPESTFTQFAAARGVTPHGPYTDILDTLEEWYAALRPHASEEQVEAWADEHAMRWAAERIDA